MVDISHVSHDALWVVMDLTKKSCIASYSSCRFFTPDFKRDMSDSMIHRLSRNNGVIQINFGTSFLDEKARKDIEIKQKEVGKLLEQKGLKPDDKAAILIAILRKFVTKMFGACGMKWRKNKVLSYEWATDWTDGADLR